MMIIGNRPALMAKVVPIDKLSGDTTPAARADDRMNRLMTEEAKNKSPPLKFDFVGSKNIRRQKPEAVGCVERSSYTVSRGLSMYVFGHDETLAVL